MSEISTRLLPNSDNAIELNAYVFGVAMMAYLLGDATGAQVLNYINAYIASKNGSALSAGAQTELANFKAAYDLLSANDQSKMRDRIMCYSQLLQNESVTEAWWDSQLGIT